MRGIVKKVDRLKGYGFILGDDGIEYFVHKSQLARGVKWEFIEQGMGVMFTEGGGAKGPRAEDVEPS